MGLVGIYDAQVSAEATEVHHDLVSRRYNVTVLQGEYDTGHNYSKPNPGDGFFTPGNIRKLGVR